MAKNEVDTVSDDHYVSRPGMRNVGGTSAEYGLATIGSHTAPQFVSRDVT